jgi:hypothetical protein
MPYIDKAAAARVKGERESRGLSPEALAREIRSLASQRGWKLGTVDAYTIRRIEGTAQRDPLVPSIRVRCVLGLYFGIPHQQIWDESRWVHIGSARRTEPAYGKRAARGNQTVPRAGNQRVSAR